MQLIRRHRAHPSSALRARDREVWAANHWAATQPLADRAATLAALEARAARINETLSAPAKVLRVGLTLQVPRGLRPRPAVVR